ncbi:2'-5' RNA ligase family protein [Botryobacter ruber]|uniref:2'-5' RNA ligase family protein n=1 Tax=Botryobacter ruber TaxID=2171629 RepID=UPI000E0BE1E9|nr:2'-5' RNA ligase family protein [Botryobacter ruber]
MNLQAHYNRLWENSVTGFSKGHFETDPLLDSPEDRRFGITVLIRPDRNVQEAITHMLQELRQLEPEQYYYPASDLHVTVLSVISCYQGFTLDAIQPGAYMQLVKEVTRTIPRFDIRFEGITASPSCVMVQGFPAEEGLTQLREQLRQQFKSSCLQQSIDTRYAIQTAHSTVVRFKTALANPAAFLKVLERYRSFNFGTSAIHQVELVCNDWYQRKRHVQQLGIFELQKSK